MRYWKVFTDMQKVPKDKRAQVYGSVAVDPELSRLIKLANKSDQEKVANYGTVVHRFSWGPPVAGKDTAVMGDCQDQSQFGVYDVTTTTPITVGTARVNEQVTFKKTTSGWKIAAWLGMGATC